MLSASWQACPYGIAEPPESPLPTTGQNKEKFGLTVVPCNSPMCCPEAKPAVCAIAWESVAVFTPQNRNVRCAELGGTARGDCRKLFTAVKILLLGSAFSSRNVGENSTSVVLQLPSLQRKEQFVPCASPPASLQRGKQRSGDVPGKKWAFEFPVRSGINHITSQETMGFKQYLLIS